MCSPASGAIFSPSGPCWQFGSRHQVLKRCVSASTAPMALPMSEASSSTRAQSILFVLVAAVALIAYAFLVVLWPTGVSVVSAWLPDWAPAIASWDILRIVATSAVLTLAVVLAHVFLPAAKPRLLAVLPGVFATLALWLVIGALFGVYLSRFASYASTYAGFAGAMIALVFLYALSAIFVLGGELNAALEQRAAKAARQ